MLAWLPTLRAVCETPGRPARSVRAHARWHPPAASFPRSLSLAGHLTHLVGAPLAGPPASDRMCGRVTAIASFPSVHETPVTGAAGRGADKLTVLSRHAGSKCRYTYVAAAGSSAGQRGFTGLAKIDLAADSPAEAVAGRVAHGAGWVGGEATFVPRTPDAADLKGALSPSLANMGFPIWQATLLPRTEDAATLTGALHPSLAPRPHKHGVPVRQHVCRTCEMRPTSRVCWATPHLQGTTPHIKVRSS